MLIIEIEKQTHEESRNKFKEWRTELVGDKAFMAVCQEKIRELFATIKEEAEYLDLTYRSYVAAAGEEKEWYLWIIERSKERKAYYEKDLRKWKAELSIARGDTERNEVNVIRAKAVPVDLILGKSNRGTGARKMYSCPLHTDKSPSMCWYVVQNKVHCFSCGFNGDVIDLFSKLNNVNFITAVNTLNRY